MPEFWVLGKKFLSFEFFELDFWFFLANIQKTPPLMPTFGQKIHKNNISLLPAALFFTPWNSTKVLKTPGVTKKVPVAPGELCEGARHWKGKCLDVSHLLPECWRHCLVGVLLVGEDLVPLGRAHLQRTPLDVPWQDDAWNWQKSYGINLMAVITVSNSRLFCLPHGRPRTASPACGGHVWLFITW